MAACIGCGVCPRSGRGCLESRVHAGITGLDRVKGQRTEQHRAGLLQSVRVEGHRSSACGHHVHVLHLRRRLLGCRKLHFVHLRCEHAGGHHVVQSLDPTLGHARLRPHPLDGPFRTPCLPALWLPRDGPLLRPGRRHLLFSAGGTPRRHLWVPENIRLGRARGDYNHHPRGDLPNGLARHVPRCFIGGRQVGGLRRYVLLPCGAERHRLPRGALAWRCFAGGRGAAHVGTHTALHRGHSAQIGRGDAGRHRQDYRRPLG
mmetsp:Transcript_66126/g.166774  ORF Transcript_66126/g.166774 Transcript_66126/m.166774 type:complete len:260 (+) Transcript_66126:582-1361(+)